MDSKPISTVEVIGSTISFIKNTAIILAVVLIEWARAKQKLAENQAEVAKIDTQVANAKGALAQKAPEVIIKDFLNAQDNPSKPPTS